MSKLVNGNGHAPPSRMNQSIEDEPGIKGLMPLPPWLQSIRDAMASSIKQEDLAEIMAAQIRKAKNGDMSAASFVFGQAHKMLQAEQKRVTIVQNNFYDGAGDEASAGEPGSAAKARAMTRRAAANLPLTREHDAKEGPRAMNDEEEKEFRRQQAAEAEGD